MISSGPPAYVIWINGRADTSKVAIATELAARYGGSVAAIDLSPGTATRRHGESEMDERRLEERARNDALMKYVFPRETRHTVVVFTDLQYDNQRGRYAYEEFRTAARIADRPFLAVHLYRKKEAPNAAAAHPAMPSTAAPAAARGNTLLNRALSLGKWLVGGTGSAAAPVSPAPAPPHRRKDDKAPGPAAEVESRHHPMQRLLRPEGLRLGVYGSRVTAVAGAAWQIYGHVWNLERGVRWRDLDGEGGEGDEEREDGEWSLVEKGFGPARG